MTLYTTNKQMNVFLATFAGVFIVDQVLLRFFKPDFKIKKFRLLVNAFKYLILPCAGYVVYK